MVGEVIGKRAYRLPDADRGVSAQRLLAFDQVGLDILQHGLELGIGIAVRRAHDVIERLRLAGVNPVPRFRWW